MAVDISTRKSGSEIVMTCDVCGEQRVHDRDAHSYGSWAKHLAEEATAFKKSHRRCRRQKARDDNFDASIYLGGS